MCSIVSSCTPHSRHSWAGWTPSLIQWRTLPLVNNDPDLAPKNNLLPIVLSYIFSSHLISFLHLYKPKVLCVSTSNCHNIVHFFLISWPTIVFHCFSFFAFILSLPESNFLSKNKDRLSHFDLYVLVFIYTNTFFANLPSLMNIRRPTNLVLLAASLSSKLDHPISP